MNLDTIHKIDTHISTFTPDEQWLIKAMHASDWVSVAAALATLPVRDLRQLTRNPVLSLYYADAAAENDMLARLVGDRLTIDGIPLSQAATHRGVDCNDVYFEASFEYAEFLVENREWAKIYKSLAPLALTRIARRPEHQERVVSLLTKIVAMVDVADAALVRAYPHLQRTTQIAPSRKVVADGLGRDADCFGLLCRIVQLFDLGKMPRIAEEVFTQAYIHCGWPTWRLMTTAISADMARAEAIYDKIVALSGGAVTDGAWTLRIVINYVKEGRAG